MTGTIAPVPPPHGATGTRTFARFENNWNHNLSVAHQSARPENFAFVQDGALFIGINLPGGNVARLSEWSTVVKADADWVTENFKQYGGQVHTAVVFAHAYPDGDRQPVGDALVSAAKDFGKPVLFMQGDLHSWKVDKPFSASNITRVVADNGSPSVRVTLTGDPSKPFLFERDPATSTSLAMSAALQSETVVTITASTAVASEDGLIGSFTITRTGDQDLQKSAKTQGNPESLQHAASECSSMPDEKSSPVGTLFELSRSDNGVRQVKGETERNGTKWDSPNVLYSGH
jgi:hypothetical protein